MLEYKNSANDMIRVYDKNAWADFDRAGNLVCQNPQIAGFVCGALSIDQLAEAADTIKKLSAAPFLGSVYLRFNDLPEGGKSVNYATGKTEKGVSCYALVWDLISGCYKRTGASLDGAMIAYAIQGAPIYFITGSECGTGSDGEPVLCDVNILSKARYDASKDGYIVEEIHAK